MTFLIISLSLEDLSILRAVSSYRLSRGIRTHSLEELRKPCPLKLLKKEGTPT